MTTATDNGWTRFAGFAGIGAFVGYLVALAFYAATRLPLDPLDATGFAVAMRARSELWLTGTLIDGVSSMLLVVYYAGLHDVLRRAGEGVARVVFVSGVLTALFVLIGDVLQAAGTFDFRVSPEPAAVRGLFEGAIVAFVWTLLPGALSLGAAAYAAVRDRSLPRAFLWTAAFGLAAALAGPTSIFGTRGLYMPAVVAFAAFFALAPFLLVSGIAMAGRRERDMDSSPTRQSFASAQS